MTGQLFDQHSELLAARAILPAVARARGYDSTMLPGWLRQQGFSLRDSELVPGLVIPIHDVHGALASYQYRPDNPRIRDGKPVKYLRPHGARNVLDVPPQILGKLADPGPPLWVTEGPLKADAGVSAGLVCIATFGVWGWKGSNARGGKVALPDWEHIALAGRDVYLVPDSDVTANEKVANAVARLGRTLAGRGANVRYVTLPPAADGAKTGLDDYLARGGDPQALITLADDEPPGPAAVTLARAPLPDPARQAIPADGAVLLDKVAAWTGRYLSVPSEHCITVITLWAAHTHAADAFYVTPRLIVDSAEPESGKTRVLELLNLIVRAPIFTMNTTIAALYRRLAGEPRTILLDETDAVFAKGAAQNHEDLRALLNAGYKRGATVDRCVGDGASMTVAEFPVFAPAALAGIAGNMPATITTRAVTIHMRRRAPDEHIAEFLEEDAAEEAAPLREELAAWASSAQLKGARPVMPAGVTDRKAEVWRALLAVADAAGGDWPGWARTACRHFVLAADPTELSLGTRLLADLRDVFRDRDAMPTADILDALMAIDEAPWLSMYGRPIDARRLSRMLGKYQVKPKVIRIGDSTPRGYTREQLADLWRRYLDPPGSATAATSATSLASHVADVADVAHTGRALCAVCGNPMDPVLAGLGMTTHPNCEPEQDPLP
jgi:hypothetical protein